MSWEGLAGISGLIIAIATLGTLVWKILSDSKASKRTDQSDKDTYFEKKADDLEERFQKLEKKLNESEKQNIRYEMAWKYLREVGGLDIGVLRTAQDIIDGRITYSNPQQ